jgi:putative flippase GtrA
MKRLFDTHKATVIQFIKFGTVGFVGFFIDWSLFTFGFKVLNLGHYGSALFSFPFTVTLTWIGNRFFTFRGASTGSVHAQWMRFMVVCGVGLVLNRGTFSLLTATVPLVYNYPVLGLLGGTAAGMFFNFFFAKKLVFR